MRKAVLNIGLFMLALLPVLLFLVLDPTIDLMRRPLSVPENIRPADVIVVLSAGLLDDCDAHPNLFKREQFGSELLAGGFSRSGKIILTGRYSRPEVMSDRECHHRLAQRFGIPSQALILENKAENTYENALYTKAILKAHGWKTALIVTHFSHSLRASLTFQAQGIPVYSAQLPDPPPIHTDRWLDPARLQHLKTFLYEYVALLKYKCYGYL